MATLYVDDDYRCLCADHLGTKPEDATEVTPELLAQMPDTADLLACDRCGAKPDLLRLV